MSSARVWCPARRWIQGKTIDLVISTGSDSPTVPNVVGADFDDAQETLEALGYVVKEETQYHATVAEERRGIPVCGSQHQGGQRNDHHPLREPWAGADFRIRARRMKKDNDFRKTV